MPRRDKSAAAAAAAAEDDAVAAPESPEIREEDESTSARRAKRRKREDIEVSKEGGEDEACMLEAIARHKKLVKKTGAARPAEATVDDAAGDVVTSAALQLASGQRRDWAAFSGEKREAKAKKKEAKRDEEAEEARQQELAAKAARNATLRKKGQMTKKEKYKAAKAALKTNKLEQQGAAAKSNEPSAGLKAQALAAAGLEKLDPRAVDCFLTGLPYMASVRHVQDHFAKIGPCRVELLTNSVTGKPTGKGFATFPTAEQALLASTYTGTRIQNRWIHVRLCEVRDNGKQRTNFGPGEKPEGCLSAVVTCDKSISEASLWKFFEDCNVIGVSRMMDKETGEFRGMAFLDFDETSMVDKAVSKNGHSIKGMSCFIRYKSDSGGGQKPKLEGGRVAAHNKAPPVPPPSGKATKFEESDSDDG